MDRKNTVAYKLICIICFPSRDGDKMAPSVEKKIAELEMGLLHLQQNIDIPEITLTIHPAVAMAIKKAAEEGRKPKVAEFGDKVEDATFLNALQGGVNRWIREIQKVKWLNKPNLWSCVDLYIVTCSVLFLLPDR